VRTVLPAFAVALALGVSVPAASAPAASKRASVAGSIIPKCEFRFPAYQTNPSWSMMRLCGLVLGSSS
jgi:hypothetical protein